MKRLFFPLFAGLLWLMSGTLSATERTYNVLFIQSYTDQDFSNFAECFGFPLLSVFQP